MLFRPNTLSLRQPDAAVIFHFDRMSLAVPSRTDAVWEIKRQAQSEFKQAFLSVCVVPLFCKALATMLIRMHESEP